MEADIQGALSWLSKSYLELTLVGLDAARILGEERFRASSGRRSSAHLNHQDVTFIPLH